MKNDWSKMRSDVERELKRVFPDNGAETSQSETTGRRTKTSILWHIIFWIIIIGGAILLFEALR